MPWTTIDQKLDMASNATLRTGENLLIQGKFSEAAIVLGQSTKSFEDVSLSFIHKAQQEPLRKYLLTRLYRLENSRTMQRIMLASWLVELYMAELSRMDDPGSTQVKFAVDDSNDSSVKTHRRLSVVREEYEAFVLKHKADLDRQTTCEIVSAYGREEELLCFAETIEDYNYILHYWISWEQWKEAIGVLAKQTDLEVFYKYSTVLILHAATDLVDILLQHSNVDIKKIIRHTTKSSENMLHCTKTKRSDTCNSASIILIRSSLWSTTH